MPILPTTKERLLLIVYDPDRASDFDGPLRILRQSLARIDLTHANIEAVIGGLDEDVGLKLVAMLERRLPDQRKKIATLRRATLP